MFLFKNKQNKININSNILDLRVNEYEKGNINIISNKIKLIINKDDLSKTTEDILFERNLAKISLFVDNKTSNTNINCHHKELLT